MALLRYSHGVGRAGFLRRLEVEAASWPVQLLEGFHAPGPVAPCHHSSSLWPLLPPSRLLLPDAGPSPHSLSRDRRGPARTIQDRLPPSRPSAWSHPQSPFGGPHAAKRPARRLAHPSHGVCSLPRAACSWAVTDPVVQASCTRQETSGRDRAGRRGSGTRQHCCRHQRAPSHPRAAGSPLQGRPAFWAPSKRPPMPQAGRHPFRAWFTLLSAGTTCLARTFSLLSPDLLLSPGAARG